MTELHGHLTIGTEILGALDGWEGPGALVKRVSHIYPLPSRGITPCSMVQTLHNIPQDGARRIVIRGTQSNRFRKARAKKLNSVV
jgi:hypothetical protein